MAETQRADPAVRRAALAAVGLVAVAGVLLAAVAAAYRPRLETWLGEDPDPRLRFITASLATLIAVPLLAFAGYVWRLGSRIRRAGRYPPPGCRVVRDTPVVNGPRADRLGRMAQAIGLLLAASSLLAALLLWRLASAMTSRP